MSEVPLQGGAGPYSRVTPASPAQTQRQWGCIHEVCGVSFSMIRM